MSDHLCKHRKINSNGEFLKKVPRIVPRIVPPCEFGKFGLPMKTKRKYLKKNIITNENGFVW